jgi:hypothetical protein
VKALWDDRVTAVRRLGEDPSFADYRPAIQAQKLAAARKVVDDQTLKDIARLEAIANSAEREAAEIRASLFKPAAPIDSNQPAVNVGSFAELPRDQRIAQIDDICSLLATPDADPRVRNMPATTCAPYWTRILLRAWLMKRPESLRRRSWFARPIPPSMRTLAVSK